MPSPLFASPDGPAPAAPDPWSLPVPASAPPVVPEAQQLVGYAPQTHLADGWDPRALGTLAPPAPRAAREPFAVPAFVLAWLVAPLGAVLGAVAVVRARRMHRRGVGLGAAAIVVGLVVSVVVPTVVLPSSGAWARVMGATEPLGDVLAPTSAYARQLGPGHCLEEIPHGTTHRVTVVPCTLTHEALVLDAVPLRGEAWPGADEVVRTVETRCRVLIAAGLDLIALSPTEAGWRAGDRTGLCVAPARPGA
ncbi:hypothetical protein ACTVCO_11745 [Sanguibacter sp. A247]